MKPASEFELVDSPDLVRLWHRVGKRSSLREWAISRQFGSDGGSAAALLYLLEQRDSLSWEERAAGFNFISRIALTNVERAKAYHILSTSPWAKTRFLPIVGQVGLSLVAAVACATVTNVITTPYFQAEDDKSLNDLHNAILVLWVLTGLVFVVSFVVIMLVVLVTGILIRRNREIRVRAAAEAALRIIEAER